jgi:hypothetical protein
MADYYGQLEAQLVELTAHGAHRRRRRVSVRALRRPVRVGVVAIAVSVLIAAAVAAALLAAAAGQHGAPHPAHPPPRSGGATILRNIYPAPFPAPPGGLFCDAPLRAPGSGAGRGLVRVYTKPPTRYEMFLTAAGLRPVRPGDAYAVWLQVAQTSLSGGYQLTGPPQLLGVVTPSQGTAGHLSIANVLPQALNGTYKLLVTVQPRRGLRRPGVTVLEGFVPL